MHPVIFLTAVSVLIGLVKSQTISVGKCPDIPVKKDFDLNKYAGTWYENTKNRRYWTIMDSGLKCTSETYTLDGNGTIQVFNKGQRILNNRIVTVKGVGRLVSPGKLAFSFEDMSFSPKDVPYWVLDTDYDNYAVVWSCTERAGLNARNVGFNSPTQTGFDYFAHGYRYSQPEWPGSHFDDPNNSQQLQGLSPRLKINNII